jgi:hypothetical protein
MERISKIIRDEFEKFLEAFRKKNWHDICLYFFLAIFALAIVSAIIELSFSSPGYITLGIVICDLLLAVFIDIFFKNP